MISKRHKEILESIKSKPGLTTLAISEATGYHVTAVRSICTELTNVGEIYKTRRYDAVNKRRVTFIYPTTETTLYPRECRERYKENRLIKKTISRMVE